MSISAAEVIRHIGNMPIGDPAAMRSHAARLRSDADRIASVAGAVAARATATRFEGPAADRFRHEIQDCLGELRRRATRLHQVAGDLDRAAAQVAASQASWHAQFRRVEAALVAAAAGKAGH